MKRPWNIIDTPIYSLATYAGDTINMNICTSVMPISLKPKLYAIAVYHHTKTLENLNQTNKCVLQILSKDQINLVRTLGKRTGKKFDKQNWLSKNDYLSIWNGTSVLKNCCAYLLLTMIHKQENIADHDLFCFQVEKAKTMSEDGVLMFQDLVRSSVIL